MAVARGAAEVAGDPGGLRTEALVLRAMVASSLVGESGFQTHLTVVVSFKNGCKWVRLRVSHCNWA